MNRDLVLHVGMHKTGTDAIQHGLASFDDDRCRYVRLGNRNHSIPILTLFGSRPADHPHYRNRGRRAADVEVLKSDLHRRLDEELSLSRERFIISGESISSLDVQELVHFRELLSRYVDRVQVMVYIREPLGFASSWFQQRVKGAAINPAIQMPSYRARFEKFLRVFGADAVEFVKYDLQGFDGGSVVADFCSRVGIGPGKVVSQRRNASLSAEATRLLYLFNRDGLRSTGSEALVKQRSRLINMLRDLLPGEPFRIPLGCLRGELDYSDIRWIEGQARFSLLNEPLPEDPDGVDFQAYLAAIEPDAPNRLRTACVARGVRVPVGAGPLELMNGLFAWLGHELSPADAASPRSLWNRILPRHRVRR